ncbi:MAG TPA: response regulator [Crinalium sp.]|jgi:PAS domain S-box-containing protein
MLPNPSSINSSVSQPEVQKHVPVGIAYYIRKLLRQNLDRLTFVVASGAGIKADPLNDLNAVIESLYLEKEEIVAAVKQLEYLSLLHQSLSSQGAQYRQELRKTEEELFWLLGFKLQESLQQGTILVVDDTPVNLHLLSSALTQHNYDVITAINGTLALQTAINHKPDLVLLDIMMPGMDGYEVCTRLKADPQTRDIPVIFISAIDDVFDKVKSFGVGGADYITKPFRIEEVLARVEHQLNIRNLQKRLEEQNERLQTEIQERRKAEALYRSIFEDAIDGIFQTTPTGEYIRVNSALARIYGYDSPEELMENINNISHQLYVHADRRDEFLDRIKQQQTLIDFESQIYRRDGSIIWISESVRRVEDTDGTVLLYEGTVKDITARKMGSS